MIGESIGNVASLDHTGYQVIAGQVTLRNDALHYTNAGCVGPAQPAQSSSSSGSTYRELVSEISARREQSVRDLVPADTASENPCGMNEGMPRSRRSHDHEQGHGSCCSKCDDFIGSVQAELIPYMPRPRFPPEKEAQNDLIEFSLHGTELAGLLQNELGAVAIFVAPWSPWHFFSRRTFVLVLRHPSDEFRGIRLFESYNREAVTAAAYAVVDALGLLVGAHVSEDIYAALLADVELQNSVVEACREEREHPQADEGRSTTEVVDPAPSAPGPNCNDCPICFSVIEPCDAAMRCAGDGGLHHYYHSECMLKWVDQCRAGLSGANCPICRGQIQFHAQRIEQFLVSEQSADLAAEDRTFLAQCVDRLKATGGIAWGNVFTLENTKYIGGMAAAGGWGFMLGYSQEQLGLQQTIMLNGLSRQHRIAQGVGWMIGLIVRVVREHQRQKRGGQQVGRGCPM